MEKEKSYFRLVVNEDGSYYFISDKGERLHFAGGKAQKKFIVQSLINLYGPEEGSAIMNKFLQGLDNIKKISPYGKGTGIFVLYPPIKDATKKQG